MSNPFEPPMRADHVATHDLGDVWWVATSFHGRIPRRIYWLGTAAVTAVSTLLVGAVGLVLSEDVATVLTYLLFPLVLWVSLALQAKRWHDLDKSAGWLLINLVPVVGLVWVLVLCGCMRGTVGPNRYGEDLTEAGPGAAAVAVMVAVTVLVVWAAVLAMNVLTVLDTPVVERASEVAEGVDGARRPVR